MLAARSLRAAAWILVGLAGSAAVQAQTTGFNNNTPRADFAGHHNYQVTGGSLRSRPNGTSSDGDDNNNNVKDACEIKTSDSATLAGVRSGATITAAYLYWGASGNGSTVDSTVSLNGNSVSATQTFTDNFNGEGYDLDYFGGVADVTTIVRNAIAQAGGGNSSYTFSGLTVNAGSSTNTNSNNPCGPSAVVAGWALAVFYSHPDEPYRYTRIYDGLKYFRDATVTTNQSGFRVPNFKDGKVTVVTWEGDPDAASSVPGASGSTESLTFGTTFRTGTLPYPANSCLSSGTLYSSKISNNLTGLCDSSKPGVDISTFDVTGFLDEGVDQASLVYSSGNDLVFLTAQIISTTNTPVIDLSVDKSHSGNFTVGSTGTYRIVVHNDGPEIAVGDNTVSPAQYTTVTDVLPPGLSLSSYAGTGWTCDVSGQTVTCQNPADIPKNGSLAPLDLEVDVSEAAIGTVSNTATVAHPMFDSNTANNSDTDTLEVPNPAPPASGNKQLYLLTTGALGSPHGLTRTRPASDGATLTWSSNNNSGYQYFQLPPLAKPLTVAGAVSVSLRARRPDTNSGSRNVSVRLYVNGTAVSNESAAINLGSSTYNNYQNVPFTLTLNGLDGAGKRTFAKDDVISLRVYSQSSRNIQLAQRQNGNYSQVQLNADTVINVDSVGFFSVPYTDANPTLTRDSWEPGDTVYIRADISDPFGGFDVSAANTKLTLADADGGALILNGVAMTPRTNPTEATSGTQVPNRILEYAYTIPASPPSFGTWTATVTGSEGLEDTIHHSRNGTFDVVPKRLSVVKSHAGDFTAGSNNDYLLTVTNEGGAIVAGTTTTVKDTLPTGLTFVSGSGSHWACSAEGQVVSCTSTEAIPANSSMAAITLTVAVAGSVGNSVDNQASVGNSAIGGGYQKPGNVDTANVLHPDLSTSTKSVADLNGGDVAPGDTLRYTITLTESANAVASNVSVTDALPANTTGLTVVSRPADSTNASTPSQLSITGITVPANGSVEVVFDVTVAAVSAGSTIDNTATIANPGGPGANPVAPTKVVLESQIIAPQAGTKVLYLRDGGSMSRVQTAAPNTTGRTVAPGGTGTDWALSPVLAGELKLARPGTIAVSLRSSAACNVGFLCFLVPNPSATVSVELLQGGTSIGTSATQTITGTAVSARAFTISLTGTTPLSIPAGTPLVLRVHSTSNNADVQIYEYNGGQSTVSFFTPTVINVDSVKVYSAPHPSTSTKTQYVQGDKLYLRAVVSDPFGAADITAAKLTLTDAGDNALVADAAMAEVTGAATASGKTFETAYTIADNPRIGSWKAKVTAIEGSEVDGDNKPRITHDGLAYATVHGLATLSKTWGDATAGDAVALTVTGGSSTVAGASTAPSTTTPATASFAPGATLTLVEAFTTGIAGNYTPALACTRSKDGAPVAVTGTGLSRSIAVPDDSAVACVWSNTRTMALMIVKSSKVVSDPVNGAINPKAIPGAIIEYEIIVSNPAPNPIDADTLFVTDPLPPQLDMVVTDFGGDPGPLLFLDGPTAGAPSSGLTLTFPDDVAFSSDGGATWDYTPTAAGAHDVDPAVNAIRINPKGAFNPDNAQFRIRFRARVQ